MSGARPPTPYAGKALSLRYSGAVASTSSWLDAATVARLETSQLTRCNSNALVEVDAEGSLARFPMHRRGVLRSRPRPDIPTSVTSWPVARARPATASGVIAAGDKTRRRLHGRSPSSIERCIFAHDVVDDEPTPAFFHAVEPGAGSACATAHCDQMVGHRRRALPRRTSRLTGPAAPHAPSEPIEPYGEGT